MSRISRRDLVVGLAVSSIAAPMLSSARSAQAQGAIPDGVFVRESNGIVWLVLGGKRVGVPIWQASDADIAAIPQSGNWAVTSVNDPGAMVAGGRPAWLSDVSPPSAPPAAPSVAAAPTTDGVLMIIETATYQPQYSPGVRVVGIIENQGGTDLGVKTIAVSLIGPAGETVGGASAVYKPTVLRAGAKAGWLAVISNVTNFAEVRVQVESGPAKQSFVPDIVHDLRIDGVTARPRSTAGLPKISGQVVNVGSQVVERPQIIGAVFSGGKLVDVNAAYATLESLAPGQSSPFEIDILAVAASDPSSNMLYVEARVKR